MTDQHSQANDPLPPPLPFRGEGVERSETGEGSSISDPASRPPTRRDALRRALLAAPALLIAPALLAACAGAPTRTARHDPFDHPAPTVKPYKPKWHPLPESSLADLPRSVIPRQTWAKGDPVPRLMNRMLPIKRITLHHDGMTTFTSTNYSAAKSRVERIRTSHRSQNWGDVGYHFLIDPAGRVWQGRPLSWQGAHVRAQNEGNIGICVMGNYMNQRPTQAQLRQIENFTATLMRMYRIPLREIHTHLELAQTACPGKHLQPRLVSMRNASGTLARVG